MRADLSWLGGKPCRLELRVDAGAAANKDWAIWSAPRVETRGGPAASIWRLRPTRLRIDDRDQAEPSGDDPALVAIYFRTSLGHRGSTRVVTRAKVTELATDRGNGAVIAIGATPALAVEDTLVAWTPGDVATADGVALAGLVLVGIERDSAGTDVVRDKVAAKARKLLTALRTHLEPLTIPAIVASPAALGDAIARVAADVTGSTPIVTGGGGLIGAIEGLLGHDPVGENRVTLFGVDDAAFAVLQPLVAGDDLVLDPTATVNPVAPLAPRTFALKLSGSGSRWTVDVVLEQVAGLITLPSGI